MTDPRNDMRPRTLQEIAEIHGLPWNMHVDAALRDARLLERRAALPSVPEQKSAGAAAAPREWVKAPAYADLLVRVYNRILSDYAEDDPRTGRTVVAEIEPLFDEVCAALEYLGVYETRPAERSEAAPLSSAPPSTAAPEGWQDISTAPKQPVAERGQDLGPEYLFLILRPRQLPPGVKP